jgi:V/A-type H+-transporting ATPase subunit I
MIRPMKRVYLFYTREHQDALVSRLQQLGLLHLEESRLESAESAPSTSAESDLSEERKRVENLLIKARGITDLFAEVDPWLLRAGAAAEPAPTRPEELHRKFKDLFESLEERLRALVTERRELQDRLAAGERFAEIVRVSEELLRRVSIPEGFTVLAPILAPEQKKFLAEIQAMLERVIPGRFTLASQALSENRLELILSVHPDYAPAVREYFAAREVRELALPPHVGADFFQGIAQLKAEQTTVPRRLREIDEALKELGRQHALQVARVTHALENRQAQLEAAMRFGYTDYTLLISGWLPQDELARFQGTLAREFPGIIIREDLTTVTYEEIPVAFRHSRWARPYQLFLRAFGTPHHGSVDPVPFISLFFPVFFGVIVGDVGYGLILFALALWGRRGFAGIRWTKLKELSRSEPGRHALRVILDASLFTILFGFGFGEFFGLEHWTPWPAYSRLHDPVPLMLFAIGIGALQVVMGLFFGMTIALRRGDLKHLCAKIGLLFAMLSIALLMSSLIGLVPPALWPPWYSLVLIGVALPLLIYGGGGVVVMEGVVALTPFVHVLSYLRLMGFAVAGVVLASLANMLISGVSTMGGVVIGLLFAAIIAIVMHAFNLVLHAFEGGVQSARLHWVEFFEKFLLEELGGKPYQPFREKPSPTAVKAE